MRRNCRIRITAQNTRLDERGGKPVGKGCKQTIFNNQNFPPIAVPKQLVPDPALSAYSVSTIYNRTQNLAGLFRIKPFYRMNAL